MKRKVYIPSIPTRWDAATEMRVPSVDLNPAADFGELIAMSNGTGDINDQLIQVADAAKKVEAGDLILCVGDVVLTASAMVHVNNKHGSINLLRWDKRRHCYDEMEVAL